MRSRSRALLSFSASLLLAAAITVGSVGPTNAATHVSAASCSKVVVAAGDMNDRRLTIATGKVAAAQHPSVVATLGDQQYPDGSLADYHAKYGTTPWGTLKSSTMPVPGHHEYNTAGAQGYFAYFGKPSYYAYHIGCGWRGYALNSLADVGAQAAWLRKDLSTHPGLGVVVSWADPRYSSGTQHGSDAAMQPFWNALAGRRGVVLNGHEHNYERFAQRGQLTEFVVGTAGAAGYPFGAPVSGSQLRIPGTPGVLVLTVCRGNAFSWRFLNTKQQTLDSGSA